MKKYEIIVKIWRENFEILQNAELSKKKHNLFQNENRIILQNS